MTFSQPESGRDVADVNIEKPVAIEITEVDAHPLKGIMPHHARFRRMQVAPAFEQDKIHFAGLGTVMEKSIGAEIVGQIEFGQEVAVQVSRAHGQSPTSPDLFAKNIGHLPVPCGGESAGGSFLPEKEVLIPAVQSLGLAFVHHNRAASFRVENARPVLKVIADEQIDMSISIKVGSRGAGGIPTFSRVD